MRYYILETQFRTDGDINFIKTEKYNFASALAYYYQRRGAYQVDTTYEKAAVNLLDENLSPVTIPTNTVIDTLYTASTEEATE